MGCGGGVFKTIFRIAIPAIVSIATGNPFYVAISAAGATAATGGSFKETLISAGTAYIGTEIGNSLSSALSNAGAQVAGEAALASGAAIGEGVGGAFGGEVLLQGAASQAAENAINAGAAAAAAEAAGSGFVSDFLVNYVPELVTNLNAVTPFADITNEVISSGLGMFNPGQTGFDVLSGIGNKTLGEIGASAVGGVAGLTLQSTVNQALDAGDQEALKSAGMTPEAIEVLSNERRKARLQSVYDSILGSDINPGLKDEEFNSIVAKGLDEFNKTIGPVTSDQFDTIFKDPKAVGSSILDAETKARRNAYTNKINQGFDPKKSFQSTTDDDIINRILDEQGSTASKQISTVAARGSLNPFGGKTANEALATQRESAQKRLTGIGDSVLSGYIGALDDILGQGRTAASNYTLGPDPFDPDQYVTKAKEKAGEFETSLERDIRTQLGNEPLFDPAGAITKAGRAQGVVSGVPNSNAILDVLAQRGAAGNRRDRGLGSRGSGVF